jgi:hypothetical protein
VAGRIDTLSGFWEQYEAPPADVYAALADVVLPESRPLEVFPWVPPLENGAGHSGGDVLVQWAVRAGRGDDLRQRLAARRKHPLAAVSAHLLEVQLGVALKDPQATGSGLAWFAERLGHDQEHRTAQDACRAGLAALELPPSAPEGRRLVEQALTLLGRDSDFAPIGKSRLALAQHLLKAGPKEAGRELIRAGLRLETVQDQNNNPPSGDTQPSEHRSIDPTEAVEALMEAEQWDDAWEALGRWADDQARQQKADFADPPASWLVLVRRWSGLPAAERYKHLEAWSFPSDGAAVRSVAALMALEDPPAVFGGWKAPGANRVLSTAQLLVAAAKETGKLDDLAARLQPLAEKKARYAADLLALVQAARGPMASGPSVEAVLEARDQPAGYPFWPSVLQPPSWLTLLVVRACLAEPRLRDAGERLARRVLEQADPTDTGTLLLRREVAAREGGSPPVLWRPVPNAQGSDLVEPLGIVRGGELQVEAGTGEVDFQLVFPLTGRFELSVEAAFGEEVSSNLGYAGSSPWPTDLGQDTPTTATYDATGNRVPGGGHRPPIWHRLAVKVEPGLARFLLDGVVVHEEKDPDPSNPFLTLSGASLSRAAFRNMQLTGDPEIPRTASLIRGDRLDAWTSAYYAGSVHVPPTPDGRFIGTRPLPEGEPSDWAARDGILDGRRREKAEELTPSVLAYQRPLQAGETVSYEFFYQPGEVMVHPALGQLGFLLEPGGVRLHWLGNFPFDEALGIKKDNTVDEPSCRRGPAELPLKANAWNQAELSLQANRALVKLNGVLIYERPLEATAGHAFGLFHYQDRTAARVRNVVLTGDWPQNLSEAQRRNLLAPTDPVDAAKP